MESQDHGDRNVSADKGRGSKARAIVGSQERVDVNASADNPKNGKTRRRGGARPADTGKRSLNLRIDDDSYKRLSVHALMRNTTISDLVMAFAQTLREFSIPHRLGNGSAKTEQEEGSG